MLKFDNTCIEYPNMTWVLDGMICSKIETQRSAQTIRANLMGRSRNCIQQTECHKHLPTFFTIRSLTFVLEFSDEEFFCLALAPWVAFQKGLQLQSERNDWHEGH